MPGRAEQRVTLRDVAKAAGVSTATVTRTLQNSPRVEPATRRRVMEQVQLLGYSPNPIARDLRYGRREAAVGLVTAGFTNLFQAGVASGAERELRHAGLQLIIGSTDDTPAREPELARAMIDRRVSALLMMPDGDHRDFLSPEHTHGTPVVLVGRPAAGLAADVVMTDDDHAVQQATQHLIGLGHHRIAALTGRLDSFRATQRLGGYRSALAESGVREEPPLVVGDLTTPQQAREAVVRLLDLPSPPTAVLALNLGISTGVLIERLAGRRAFAFIGLDETDVSKGLGVSAVVRDPQEVGRQAARLAIDRIATPDRPPRTATVPSAFVRRGTGEVGP
ncbi:LacI family DNA-binding transcriptional regulator [Streptomyces sp. RTd22]|uniref:LacI family DNA-binding transcriptional regulator n=1 Tax=Streptomyces sp. RTd22 TaxID=1841249 RepID=UPI0007C504F4|nr:LacI family DNA-binding transcriptional regulator [Streptomyces sp. RTd22]